jgi:thiol-disulfide isomerase/thioredoxin
MKLFAIYILIVFNVNISSQTITIKVNNLSASKVQLSYLRGESVNFIDSLLSFKNEFHYTFAKNTSHPGFYRIHIASDRWIDFIIDNEDVYLITDANNITDSMKVIRSENNKLYYEFLELNKQYTINTGELFPLLDKYSKDDKYSISIKNRLDTLQKEYINSINIIYQKNFRSYAARYIRTIQMPEVDVNLSIEEKVDYLKSHFLDNINFDDDDLLYSDAFTIKTLKYITLFRNRQLSNDLLTKGFLSAVDTLLNKAKVNQLVYQDITECLIDKFKELGFNMVIDYIVDHYVIKDDLCLDERLPNSIQQRIDQSKSFLAGRKIPNIAVPDSTGKLIDLNDINSEYTLILFYASWCPHCQKLLPGINELYLNQKEWKLKIFAVSLDTNKSDWLNYIRKNNYNWINISDLKGGHSKAVRDYKIYATPSMFLVNNKKELIAIVSNIEELKKYFQ